MAGFKSQLTYLKLSSCRLTSADLNFLSSSETVLRLAHLDVANNKLKNHWPALKSLLSKLGRLRMLQMETSDLRSEDFADFFDTLRASCPILQCLEAGFIFTQFQTNFPPKSQCTGIIVL